MSLPLNVLPSPQMWTSSSFIAETSIVPVTARPIGVVLKYGTPAVEMWNAPHWSAAMPFGDELARGSRSAAPSRRRTAAPGAGCRRSRARRAGRGWPCRRRGSRPCRASSAAPRSCRGRRRTRCRHARRREGAEGWWPWVSHRLRMRFARRDSYFQPCGDAPDRGCPPSEGPCGKLAVPRLRPQPDP